jgi:hypothetical protein
LIILPPVAPRTDRGAHERDEMADWRLSKRAVLAAIELREHYNLKETFATDLL